MTSDELRFVMEKIIRLVSTRAVLHFLLSGIFEIVDVM